ncbi:unnamed protein product [Prorocentrum cordatum]|uniref:Vacuolar protein sorting-associated protein 51 homolog n=1 Tax=Prorocentrum cordatum TaxID=2364126 RepID=A0ABN9UUP7_9DINO|nr:unnamed protein product [Polarella glacialis]
MAEPAQGSRRRRVGGLLNAYYRIEGAEKQDQPEATQTSDLDRQGFDAKRYFDGMVASGQLGDLVKHARSLDDEVQDLDGDMQKLVYENYSKFIRATDVIKQMKFTIEGLQPDFGRLDGHLGRIDSAQARAEDGVAQRSGQIEVLLTQQQNCRKLQVLFGLPATLRSCLDRGAYGRAVEAAGRHGKYSSVGVRAGRPLAADGFLRWDPAGTPLVRLALSGSHEGAREASAAQRQCPPVPRCRRLLHAEGPPPRGQLGQMEPGESPLAYYLRTQAKEEVKQVAAEVTAAEAGRKDAFWKAAAGEGARVVFQRPGVHVAPAEGRGSGLFAREAVRGGDVVLQETALTAVPVQPEDAAEPILATVRLAAALLGRGLEPQARALAPRPGREFDVHPARRTREAELRGGLGLLRARCPASRAVDDEAALRLLLAVSLNSHTLALPGGQVHLGLFTEVGCMVNHSCRPNMVCRGVAKSGGEGGYDELRLVLQAVRDVEPGEELTVSYLTELYLQLPERDERLLRQHGFKAERLPTDVGLEALVAANNSKENIQRVLAANERADDAWERARELAAADADAEPEAGRERERQSLLAAQHYASLLNVNLLAETHAWRYNACQRLAQLLTRPNAPKSCAQAIPLWESAMRSGSLVWPSDLWPDHRRLLRGLQRAAAGAGDVERATELAARPTAAARRSCASTKACPRSTRCWRRWSCRWAGSAARWKTACGLPTSPSTRP